MNNVMITAIIGVIVIVLGVVSCNVNKQDRIADAIKAGKDPIMVKCSMDIMSSSDITCIIEASKNKELLKTAQKPNVIVN